MWAELSADAPEGSTQPASRQLSAAEAAAAFQGQTPAHGDLHGVGITSFVTLGLVTQLFQPDPLQSCAQIPAYPFHKLLRLCP